MPKKIYCYVDESGQDTEGRLFVVVAVVVGEGRDVIEAAVTALEERSRRTARKWHRSQRQRRVEYAAGLPSVEEVCGHVFARVYGEGANYLDRTAYVIGDAIAAYAERNGTQEFTGVAVVDGLKDAEAKRMSKLIRSRGIRLAKLRGAKDEVSPLVRLADSVAGILRDAADGDEVFRDNADRLRRGGILLDI